MKKHLIAIFLLSGALVGCESAETKAQKQAIHLAALTCESTREGRNREELKDIGDACFRRGTFQKSTGRSW